MEAKITWGYELPKEAWVSAAENLKNAAPVIADILRKINHDGEGEQDAEEYLTDMQLAYMAMHHVADFARDKCRIIPIPDKKETGS